jgi:hypothetical protein
MCIEQIARCAPLFHRGKRAEQANNYPFQRIFKNLPPYGKDPQRYRVAAPYSHSIVPGGFDVMS